MVNDVLKTSADELHELVKSRKKISVEEAAKLLRMPINTVHALVDFLVEEKIFGIEYKFTTPYIYISQEHPKSGESFQGSFAKNMATKEEFFEKAKNWNISFDKIYEMWNKYIKENLDAIKKEFYMKAGLRGISGEDIDMLWEKYLSYLQ
ncbi:hypothetical protein HYU50_05015 [Candidatus Woesearchaeota archaeon]|nr:hypothetical protein [Candidatus Woesearchaeota archaeon]